MAFTPVIPRVTTNYASFAHMLSDCQWKFFNNQKPFDTSDNAHKTLKNYFNISDEEVNHIMARWYNEFSN